MTPVRLDYVADDYVAAMKLHGRWSTRRLLVSVGTGAVAAIALFFLPPAWPAVAAAGVLGGAIGMLVCYALSWLFYLPWKARRMFGQQKSLHETYELAWDDEGMSIRGRLGQGTTPWDSYLKKKENERIVLLYQSDLLFQMLPRRAFTAVQMQALQPYLERVGRAA
ncbi:YcxB family protein [Dokdonella ginsengisoli]|uniref:YcxB family protein n=1 Tax=Dokdonella ginsengisoli TaxID=363846 RepID=A0ABV9QYB2_9GAMM